MPMFLHCWSVPTWLTEKAQAFWSAAISWWDERQLIIFFLPQGSRTKLRDASDSWKTGWGLTEQSCATATRMWVPGTVEWASTIIQTMVIRVSNIYVFPSVESPVESNKCLMFFRSHQDLQTDTNNCSIVLKNFKQFHLISESIAEAPFDVVDKNILSNLLKEL